MHYVVVIIVALIFGLFGFIAQDPVYTVNLKGIILVTGASKGKLI